MNLYWYQQEAHDAIISGWEDHDNLCLVKPTGSGKTVTMTAIIATFDQPTFAIAHRQELVGQISIALARYGILHNIIGPPDVTKFVIRLHIREFGYPFIDTNSAVYVIGIDTLVRREPQLRSLLKKTKLWVIDEGHHVLKQNKWGRAVSMFPTGAKGLGATATLCRSDKKGLGAHNDGVYHGIIVGPTARDLIDWKFLTDYRIFVPPNDLNLSDVSVTRTGDFSNTALARATKRSHLVGDVVEQYLKIAPGLPGITFAVDIEDSDSIATRYNDAGVAAVSLNHTTPADERVNAVERLKTGDILQLVNVGLFGEGFDLPAIHVVSMARPTMSYGLYVQMFGRALRLMEGKDRAIIIDHVGNVVRHGLPDKPVIWTLEAGSTRGSRLKPEDDIPLRVCDGCTQTYPRFHTACPWCGWVPVPAGRSSPIQVDGDLHELSPETLAEMRQEVVRIDRDPEQIRQGMLRGGANRIVAAGAANQHKRRQDAQMVLRQNMAWFGGFHKDIHARSESETQRMFFHLFNVDVMSAQSLGRPDAETLNAKVRTYLNNHGVTS